MASKKHPYVEFYKDSRRKWRWRAKAANGKTVADCAEAYNSKAAADKGATVAMDALAGDWRYPE